MKQTCFIRNEKPEDHREVEEMTRNAFWNLYVPGCDEHYLVHIMRDHEDFVPELALVAVADNRIVGNVMYTKAWLTDEQGEVKEILTFGPLTVHKECQRRGYGKALLEESFKRALKLGYDTVIIMGNPGNYVSRGFKSCRKFNVSMKGDVFPTAMLVKELVPGVLDGKKWVYGDSSLFQIDKEQAELFDLQFEPKEKGYHTDQEEFYIYSHSVVVGEEEMQREG